MYCGLVKDRFFYTKGKRCVEHVANMGERCVQVLVGKLVTKKLLVRPRRRWEDNNKKIVKGLGWGRGINLSASGQNQVVCSCDVIKEIQVL
jgi:hypothetical protein